MKGHTKYLFSMGELHRKDNSILFKNDKGNNYIPIENIREIYCFNEVTFNTKFLELIAKIGIIVHYFNYYGGYVGTFYPKEYLISGNLTVKQANTYMTKRLDVAKSIVKGIGDNIYEVLYHYYRHDKKELKECIDWLKNDIPGTVTNFV